ncbi:hypothetical protein ACGFMK_31830 [Amycolatopsis sp. NPDC049252]|uniref:hypothetical protein n=1 Tax=Amycolatopsis sp. NPDC049252 TaxID=3363933 RepID=UPI0037105D0D
MKSVMASLATAVFAISGCLTGATMANATQANGIRYTEIGTGAAPVSVKADLARALANSAITNEICYSVHISNVGWSQSYCNGETVGDYHNQIEAIVMAVSPDFGEVQYRAHVENIGWQGWVSNGAVAGTQGQALRMEAMQAELYNTAEPNRTISYRVYLPNQGAWDPVEHNGQVAGTTGLGWPITALWVYVS